MAINENVSLEQNHHLILATSGGGKSHLTKHLLKSEDKQLIWDPNRDHYAHHFPTHRTWYANALKAISSGASKYRLALKVENPTPEAFELWCKLVWTLLDGNDQKSVVVEEVADVVTSVGKAAPWWGRVIKQGRKYGARIYCTAQFAHEIDKTIVRNTRHKYVGNQGDDAEAAKYAMRMLGSGVTAQDVLSIPDYNFYYKKAAPDGINAHLIKAPK